MPNTDQLLKDLNGKFSVELPEEYLRKIDTLLQSAIITHPRLPNRTWRIRVPKELIENSQVDRHKGSRWETVSLFGKTLRDIGIRNLNGTGRKPLEFLDHSFAFADDNGDYLFLRADSSVWIFYHDGHELRQLADSFEKFETKLVWPRALELSDTELNEWERKLKGSWGPLMSKTQSDTEIFELTKFDLILNEDRTAVLVFSDETIYETWYADSKTLTYTMQGHELPHTYQLEDGILDLTTQKFQDHTQYQQK